MKDRIHSSDTVLIELVAVACAIVFAVFMFFNFVEWVGPYSGALSSPEVGKDLAPLK
jgi:hypothetical protein